MSSVPSSIFCASLNHLLRQQSWASERLARHSGARIHVLAPAPLPPLHVCIAETGLMEPASGANEPQLRITLAGQALPLLLTRKDEALKYIELSGSADLAAAIQEVFLRLEWDAEEDLSRVVGDVAAHRVAQTGRDFLAWQRDALERGARNFTEYWTEERPLLARRAEVGRFKNEVESLTAAVDQIVRRVEALRQRLPR